MNTQSKKGFTLVEIMIVVVIIGLLAAMAIPAFQKVRATSQEKAILNNLRQLASAADQYFLEYGVETIASDKLVGDGSYVKAFSSVASESYSTSITTGTDIQATDVPTAVSNTGILSVDF
ncbi:MAG TPA: pilus assembly protein [Opitutae bacterium]|nr:pilus assembly protein [Puniceicoccaceae bacterium]HBR92942.1 pilus assembly protein [Opitutae bacterium]|tara:strand:- start:269 stop:628 length:360 start_codon:yes stop_codon:yes gene_type:complete